MQIKKHEHDWPPPLHSHTSTIMNSNLYLIGGVTKDGKVNGDVYWFNLLNWNKGGGWVKHPSPKITPQPFWGAKLFGGGYFFEYIFGGMNEKNELTNALWRYTPGSFLTTLTFNLIFCCFQFVTNGRRWRSRRRRHLHHLVSIMSAFLVGMIIIMNCLSFLFLVDLMERGI